MYRILRGESTLSLSLSLAPLVVSILFFALPAQAALYAPGETLDPACAPTDLNCGIEAQVGTGTTGQVPYYAAGGSVLTATSSITILSNGNVGIGTTTPANKLDVYAITAASAGITSTNQYNILSLNNVSGNGSLQNIIRFNNNGTSRWSIGNDAANGNAFTFSNASLLNSGARMVLTTAGNVGLGTTTPAFKLDVIGGGVRAQDFVIGTTSSTTTRPNIVFVGDSLTTGALGTNPYNYYITLPTYNGQTFNSYNIGVSGYRVYQMIDNAPALNGLYSRYTDLNIVVLWGGINDLKGGASAATVYSYLKEFAEHERRLGFKVIVATVISGVGIDVQRNELNALIRQNWPSFADGLADIAADPNLGVDGGYANSTYYQSDQVHLTDSGYSLVGSLVQPAIEKLVQNVSNKTFVNLSTYGSLYVGTTTPAATSTSLFSVFNGATTPLTVSPLGNIGIGTSTPASYHKLNVYNSGNTWVGFQAVNQYNIIDLDSLYSGAAGDNAIRFLDNGTTRWSIGQSGGNSDAFTFSTSALLSSGPKLTLTTAGSLGLGTTSPATNFHITGSNASFAGQYIQNDSATKVSNAPYAYLALLQGGTSGAGISGWANAGIIESTGVGGLVLDAYGSNGGPIIFQTSRSSKMIITAAGNVGVATTSPWRTFSVAGTVSLDGLTASVGAGSLCLSANKEVVYNATSDNCLSSTRETKHSINNLALSELELLQQLNPVSFVYNGDFEERLRYGFIADEANDVDEHLVTRDAAGKLSGLDTSGFLAVIVGAIQELSFKVTAMTDEVLTKFVRTDWLESNTIETNTLCIGSTCLTESQLQKLLEDSGQQSSYTPPPAPQDSAPPADEEPADAPVTEEPPVNQSPTDEAIAEEIAPEPEPEEEPADESVPETPASDSSPVE